MDIKKTHLNLEEFLNYQRLILGEKNEGFSFFYLVGLCEIAIANKDYAR